VPSLGLFCYAVAIAHSDPKPHIIFLFSEECLRVVSAVGLAALKADQERDAEGLQGRAARHVCDVKTGLTRTCSRSSGHDRERST
jgi:hypothetical protein